MTKLKKITSGYVTQVFDTDKNEFIEQYFHTGDNVEWEDSNGHTITCPLSDPYLPFDMVQPNE